MIIIHGMNKEILPRFVADSLTDRLRVMPAVIVTGARQTGKSTLVQKLATKIGSTCSPPGPASPRIGASWPVEAVARLRPCIWKTWFWPTSWPGVTRDSRVANFSIVDHTITKGEV